MHEHVFADQLDKVEFNAIICIKCPLKIAEGFNIENLNDNANFLKNGYWQYSERLLSIGGKIDRNKENIY